LTIKNAQKYFPIPKKREHMSAENNFWRFFGDIRMFKKNLKAIYFSHSLTNEHK